MDDATIVRALRECGNGGTRLYANCVAADGKYPDCVLRIAHAAADRLEAMGAENARLQQWVSDLQSGMYVNCVYCGHRYGPGETTPVTMADALKKHVENCPKHPMSALRVDRDAWKARAEAAEMDLRIANKCITCAYNTGREGKDFCTSPDFSIRFVNRKEDRYIRCECCGWKWRGPCAENSPAPDENGGKTDAR